MVHFSLEEISRATSCDTIPDNEIRLHFEGPSMFEAWLDSIAAAEKFVYFENYLVRDDEIGRAFRDALVRKAEEGVPVYLIYDWFGCWATPRSFWKPLRKAGVHLIAFNPPTVAFGNPFGALQRDHRKLVVVDGDVAYLGGMCVGTEWAGTATRAPWRDTGVEIRGPAAVVAGRAFETVWDEVADPIFLAATLSTRRGAEGAPDGSEHVRIEGEKGSPPGMSGAGGVDGVSGAQFATQPQLDPERRRLTGKVPVWLIEGQPGRARVYRTLHLAASRALRSIWITDAYFVAPRPLSEALAAAAQQGVDVRILVPAHNNWPIVGSVSRGGYRDLLEAGVRIFEWQGEMIHAKTAVVDGVWSRIGSSNLNTASLLGNWELDVGVLDEDLGRQMEGLFLADLASSVEIVLPGRTTIGGKAVSTAVGMSTVSLDPEEALHVRIERRLKEMGTSPGRLTLASVVRASDVLGHALAGNRTIGREDRTVVGLLAVAVLLVAVVAALLPTVTGLVIAVVSGWLGLTIGVRALVQSRRAHAEEQRAERFSSEQVQEES